MLSKYMMNPNNLKKLERSPQKTSKIDKYTGHLSAMVHGYMMGGGLKKHTNEINKRSCEKIKNYFERKKCMEEYNVK
jgi:hypothetical protein